MSATPTDLPADLDASYRILREAAGWWSHHRDVVIAAGEDATAYLQGQLSQDVSALAVGASVPSLLLHPDGKVVAWLRVTRLADDRLALDTDAGSGAAVMARLRRFLLRVKVELSDPGDGEPLRCLSVRGPAAATVEVRAGDGAIHATVAAADLPGYDVLLPPGTEATVVGPAPAVDAAAYEAIRIEQGLPAMGAELTDKTIPGEAGAWLIDASVSFTKGCYTGQELVARIDSRGNNVPRHLRAVVLGDHELGSPPPVGAELLAGDKVVGTLTSVAWSPGRNRAVALAFVGRAIEPPADVTVRWDEGATTGSVQVLPLPAP